MAASVPGPRQWLRGRGLGRYHPQLLQLWDKDVANDDSVTRPAAPAGSCWFCGSRPGGMQSLALPFWSNHSDEVKVLVLPRCADCFEFHHRQQLPTGLIMLGSAMLAGVLVSLLPLGENWRTPVMAVAIVSGFVGGIVIAADREGRQARARGTRASADHVQHPPYLELAGDTKQWRQARGPGIASDSGSQVRRETITEYRTYFLHVLQDAAGFKALQRGCREAGIEVPEAD